jgi:hypothetical protein
MVWITGQTLTNSTTQFVAFNSIPQTFTHLQFRCYARSTAPNPSDYFAILNGSSVTGHTLYGTGASALSSAGTGSFGYGVTQIPAANATANIFSPVIFDLLDYTSTNKTKVFRSIAGYDANGSGYVSFASTFDPASTAAITGMNFFTGATFLAGSRFDLYGITSSQVTGA